MGEGKKESFSFSAAQIKNENRSLEKWSFNFVCSYSFELSLHQLSKTLKFIFLPRRIYGQGEWACQVLGHFHTCLERHDKLSPFLNCHCHHSLAIRTKKQQKEIVPPVSLTVALPLACEIYQFPRIGSCSWIPVNLIPVSLSVLYSLKITVGR